ncbi:P-loop domain-containing protein, partial [Streptomyces niveus]
MFTPLPSVTQAVQELASALKRAGAVTSGPPLLECDESEFLRRWQDLRRQVDPGEPLVLHFAGHGVQAGSGSLYLATSGGQAREDLLFDTCVSFGQLLETAENSRRPVLFLLDVCEAGQALVQQQLAELAARRRQDAPRNVWVIGACSSGAITYGARFTTAAAEVLHQLADGDLDITPTLRHVPVETLATAVDRRLAHTDRASGRTRQRLVRTPHVEADAEPQPFFPNPAHTGNPHSNMLAGMDPRLREFALGCSPDLDPLHFATRAAGTPTANDILFSGRRSQLDRIQKWADGSADQGRLLVVTGNPGSGKSALLGVTACLLHPELEPLGDRIARTVEHFAPRQPDAVLAVHARQLTLQQITDSLHHQLHQQKKKTAGVNIRHAISPQGTKELLHELQTAGDVLVVLDALDEAVDASAVLNELLLPLARTGPSTEAEEPSTEPEDPSAERVGCRVMIGTRKWWDTLPALHQHLAKHPQAELDLDPITDHDRRILADDLDIYLRRLLPPRRCPRDEVRHIADRLAQYSDHGAFLVASLYANHLLTTSQGTPADPPCTITEVFDLHVETLAANDPWIRTVLNVLGQARGQGMPLDLIHTIALAHQLPDPDQVRHPLADTRRALNKAAFYLRTTSDTDHRLLYRYFHQALTEHTEAHADVAALHHALMAAIPTAEDDAPDWAHAHPYLLRHAADHAATSGNGALDQLLTDPRYLLHANPDTLTPHLHHARTEQGIIHANIYRSTVAHDPRRHQAEARRALLAFDAVAWQQPNLAHTLTRVPLHGQPIPPTPAWATRRTRPAGPHSLTATVHGVATMQSPIGPLAVTGSRDGNAIVWDLTSGTRLHTLTGHTAAVYTVATAQSPRGPLAVTGSRDGNAIVWDLTSGTRLHTL